LLLIWKNSFLVLQFKIWQINYYFLLINKMDWPYSFTPYSIKQAYSYLDEARSIGADIDLWGFRWSTVLLSTKRLIRIWDIWVIFRVGCWVELISAIIWKRYTLDFGPSDYWNEMSQHTLFIFGSGGIWYWKKVHCLFSFYGLLHFSVRVEKRELKGLRTKLLCH